MKSIDFDLNTNLNEAVRTVNPNHMIRFIYIKIESQYEF